MRVQHSEPPARRLDKDPVWILRTTHPLTSHIDETGPRQRAYSAPQQARPANPPARESIFAPHLGGATGNPAFPPTMAP